MWIGQWEALWGLRAEALTFTLLSLHMNETVLSELVPNLFRDISLASRMGQVPSLRDFLGICLYADAISSNGESHM